MAISDTAMKAANVAQKELAAFLRAITEAFGSDKTQHAADLWLEALEKTEQVHADSESFFRHISIEVTHRLAKDSKVNPAYALLALDIK